MKRLRLPAPLVGLVAYVVAAVLFGGALNLAEEQAESEAREAFAAEFDTFEGKARKHAMDSEAGVLGPARHLPRVRHGERRRVSGVRGGADGAPRVRGGGRLLPTGAPRRPLEVRRGAPGRRLWRRDRRRPRRRWAPPRTARPAARRILPAAAARPRHRGSHGPRPRHRGAGSGAGDRGRSRADRSRSARRESWSMGAWRSSCARPNTPRSVFRRRRRTASTVPRGWSASPSISPRLRARSRRRPPRRRVAWTPSRSCRSCSTGRRRRSPRSPGSRRAGSEPCTGPRTRRCRARPRRLAHFGGASYADRPLHRERASSLAAGTLSVRVEAPLRSPWRQTSWTTALTGAAPGAAHRRRRAQRHRAAAHERRAAESKRGAPRVEGGAREHEHVPRREGSRAYGLVETSAT